MKRILFPALCALMFTTAYAAEPQSIDMDVRVVTCNVRYMNAEDGGNSWDFRKERLAAALKGLNADVIGTQEAVNGQKKFLNRRLKGYKVVGVGREDGKKKGEHSAIFYNKKRFEALDCGNFWLSETPDKPSLGWDAACIRIATWAFLKERSTGKLFFFVNTHLDHVGITARSEGVSLLIRKAHEIGGGCPMVITGDFNIYNDSEEITRIKEMGLTHVYDIATEKKTQKCTWHGYEDMDRHVINASRGNGRDIPAPQIIDYIFINEGSCSYYEIMPPKAADGGYLSDHCPVFADITL